MRTSPTTTSPDQTDAFATYVADQLPISIGFVDADQRYQYVNASYCHLLGLPPDRVIGRRVEEVIGDDKYRNVRGNIEAALRGEPREAQVTAAYPNMGEREYHLSYTPHRDAAGAVDGYALVITDVTERAETDRRLREREERIRLITDNVPVMIAYCDADERYQFVNRIYTEWFGMTRDEIVGHRWHEILGEENARRIRPRIQRALQGERIDFEDEIFLPDGRRHRMRGALIPHEEDGVVKGTFVLREDVTELRETIEALRAREENFNLLANNVPAVICYIDRNLRYRFANRALLDWFGLEKQDVIGKHVSEIIDPETLRSVEGYLQTVLSGERTEFEDVITSPTMGTRHCRVIYEPNIENGEVVGFYLFRTDVTAAKRAETELRYFAAHDPLTGLPNRRFLQERFVHATDLAKRKSHPLCLLLIDLDGFKSINDEAGHQAGDLVLTAVAARLRDLCRQSDTVVRLGGDEFVLLLETNATPEGGVTLAQRISMAIADPIVLGDGTSRRVGASIGIASIQSETMELDDALRMADEAMYAAKRSRSEYALFDRSMAHGHERVA